MAFSTTFRNWRTTAMDLLAQDSINTGKAFTGVGLKNTKAMAINSGPKELRSDRQTQTHRQVAA